MAIDRQELIIFIKYINRSSELMSELENQELDNKETIMLFKTLIHQIEMDKMMSNDLKQHCIKCCNTIFNKEMVNNGL